MAALKPLLECNVQPPEVIKAHPFSPDGRAGSVLDIAPGHLKSCAEQTCCWSYVGLRCPIHGATFVVNIASDAITNLASERVTEQCR